MAAAPRGATNLNYEAEESSIISATKNLGLEMVVEESGELDLLAACVAREKPDVVQISCHGLLEPYPSLLLEDATGDAAFAESSSLASELASTPSRLLFLSACESAQSGPVLDSLARSLVTAGMPAVLGWAGPVLDNEASLFATHLYRRLTEGEHLASALASARCDLNESLQSVGGAENWHLVRLYLNSTGGGALATAGGLAASIAGVER